MAYLVPFDGSPLSKAALARARLYAVALEHTPSDLRGELLRDQPLDVIALSVIPESARYAREKGWIGEDEEFTVRGAVEGLHQMVIDIDPGASFQYERVDTHANAGTISTHIRRRAESENVSVVFIGSENAGRIITPVSSVGGGVTASQNYDVHIVKREMRPEVRKRLKSEFFVLD